MYYPELNHTCHARYMRCTYSVCIQHHITKHKNVPFFIHTFVGLIQHLRRISISHHTIAPHLGRTMYIDIAKWMILCAQTNSNFDLTMVEKMFDRWFVWCKTDVFGNILIDSILRAGTPKGMKYVYIIRKRTDISNFLFYDSARK